MSAEVVVKIITIVVGIEDYLIFGYNLIDSGFAGLGSLTLLVIMVNASVEPCYVA